MILPAQVFIRTALFGRVLASALEPVLFTLEALSVYLFAVALLLFTVIVLFVVHWRCSPRGKFEEPTEQVKYEAIPGKITTAAADEPDISKMKYLEPSPGYLNSPRSYYPSFASSPVELQQEEYRSLERRQEDRYQRLYQQNVHQGAFRYDQGPRNVHPFERQGSEDRNRFSQYDNVRPNQYQVTYLRDSDLV